jgi:small subunit ribosomal protein S6
MREYELMLILQPTLEDDGVNTLIGQVGEVLQRDGGQLVSAGQLADRKGTVVELTEGWKARRLAFPIRNQRQGYYAILRFNAEPVRIDGLERVLKLNESVLRYLVLRADEVA